MATKRTGLGRGIGALIPTSDDRSRPVDVFFPDSVGAGAPSGIQSPTGEKTANEKREPELVAVPGARLANLDPADITPNAQQPRTDFRPDELQELVVSIREYGVLQPIVVRPLGSDETGRAKYELVMGERRLRATKELGLDTIPAVIKDTADESMLRDALLENLHRSELNPLEEASAYQQLLADFAITQDELAQRLGRSRPQITNTIRLLRLPEDVQHRVAAGVLSAGHARAILSSGDEEAMRHLADKIVNEDLSVRAAEAAAQKGQRTTKPRKSSSSARDAHLDEAAQRIGDHLNTSVRVTMSAQKGQILIDFATLGDLTRIVQEMGVPDGELG
ncbi:ParB/RepB/Spo0J family partition protein [Clavibacter sp. Sh2141]|uniref:ParB/RepB/Spo0J family partition protein n=1 Tax=Clavibacter sp. Sh2141 TaxID=3395374 RepID=UPI0039BD6222